MQSIIDSINSVFIFLRCSLMALCECCRILRRLYRRGSTVETQPGETRQPTCIVVLFHIELRWHNFANHFDLHTVADQSTYRLNRLDPFCCLIACEEDTSYSSAYWGRSVMIAEPLNAKLTPKSSNFTEFDPLKVIYEAKNSGIVRERERQSVGRTALPFEKQERLFWREISIVQTMACLIFKCC